MSKQISRDQISTRFSLRNENLKIVQNKNTLGIARFCLLMIRLSKLQSIEKFGLDIWPILKMYLKNGNRFSTPSCSVRLVTVFLQLGVYFLLQYFAFCCFCCHYNRKHLISVIRQRMAENSRYSSRSPHGRTFISISVPFASHSSHVFGAISRFKMSMDHS